MKHEIGPGDWFVRDSGHKAHLCVARGQFGIYLAKACSDERALTERCVPATANAKRCKKCLAFLKRAQQGAEVPE